GGISSLQLGLRAVWTEAQRRGFSLAGIARWMAAAPAMRVGLDERKGGIRPGAQADVVVFEPQTRETVRGADPFHRHKLTPYDGLELVGNVRTTYLRGRRVYD